MELILYNCLDSNNTINKTVTDEEVLDVNLKERTNITNPIIKLRSKTFINKNYCFIPTFDRFYFIEDVTFLSNDIQEIQLKCDVLESFKNDILNSKGVITKSNEDNYLSSGRLNTEKRIADVYKGDVINYKDNIVLVGVR